MPTNINFNKKLGFINGTSIVLPSGSAADFSTRSLSFDGVDDYVSTQEVYSELDGQTKATFSLWVKPQLNQYGILFHIPRNTTSAQGQVLCFLDNSYRVRWSMDTTSYYAPSLTNVITLNAWNHILICIDLTQGASQNRSRVFINGVNQTAVSNLSTRNAFSTSTGSLLIGEETLGYLTPFLGNIDEFAIWAGQDLRNDVATIYNNGKPADLTSLNPTSWYRAGESSTFAYPQILMPEDTNKDKVSKYSLAFDGTSDYIDCGNPDEFSFGNSKVDSRFSISAWIKPSSIGTTFHILNKENNTTTGDEYVLYITNTNILNFAICDQNFIANRQGRKTSALTAAEIDNVWCHIVATYDGSGGNTASNGINIYVNGVNRTSGTFNAGSYTAMHNTTSNVKIGSYSSGVYSNGKIDEAAIFPVELSQLDVQAIYNSGVPTDISSYSPVGYWKLGEEAKFTNNWLVPNSALSNFSKYSFNFDGLDDYIDVANGTTIGRTQNISYSIWLNLVDGTVKQYLVGNWNSSNGGTGLSIETGGTLVFQLGDGTNDSYFNSRVANFTTYAPNNTWNHVLATWDGTDAKIYINGTLRNTWTPTSLTISNWSTFHIARRFASTVNNLTNGKLDEIALWDSGLSAFEVTAIYNGGKPKDLSGFSPISWWRMGEEATYDGGTNQFTIPDQGSGGNTGTSSNTMLLETLVGDTPQYYGGGISDSMDIFDRVGDAPVFTNNFSLEFDGIDDYVNVGSSSLGITSAITVSAWVKIPTSNTGGASPYIQMIVCEDNTSGGQRNWGLSWRGTGYNYFSFQIWHTNLTNTSINSTGITPNDGQWHHLLGTYDGSTGTNGMKFYIDGVLNGQKTATSTGLNSYSSTETTMGAVTGGVGRRFEGNIDEVAVWNSDQNANASTIYNSGTPNDISSLSPLSWWRFEEGTGTTAKDSGSGGNDGTLSTTLGPLYDTDRILAPKANNTVSFNMEEADIVEDTP